jgi:hypothetical protein
MDVTPDNRDMPAPAENRVNRDMFKRKIPQPDKDAVKKRLFMSGKVEPFRWTYEQPAEDCLIIDDKEKEEKTSDMAELGGEKSTEGEDTKTTPDRYVSINMS